MVRAWADGVVDEQLQKWDDGFVSGEFDDGPTRISEAPNVASVLSRTNQRQNKYRGKGYTTAQTESAQENETLAE